MTGREVHFVDTTLRDGAQSLWALNMRTNDMVPALRLIDAAGFDAAEYWVPLVHLRKMAKDLNENPWPWVEAARSVLHTPLRYHGGIHAGLGDIPTSISRLMIKTALDHGITTTRLSDPWNNIERVRLDVEELASLGMKSVVNIIYTVSPAHDQNLFVRKTAEAAAMRPYRICFKDVGGLLLPEVAKELLPRIVEAAGDVPVEFHAHCNNGLAPYNSVLAAEAGIGYLHGAIPPLANGSSLPSIFTLHTNLTAAGHSPQLDLEPLRRVAEHFDAVAARDGHPPGVQSEFDQDLYRHQVPGGMMSNLQHQLAKMGMADKLAETLDEAARVRAEFGYPIMVTPLSQFVGSQAAINVITGERYGTVTDETIAYALGRFGSEAVELMDSEVRAVILGRPRAQQIADTPVPDPSLEELRELHGSHLSDVELMLRVSAGVKSSDLAMPNLEEAQLLKRVRPLVEILTGLMHSTAYAHIELTGQDLNILLSRH